jgi:hypothetical protein
LRLLVVENSVQADSRSTNLETLDRAARYAEIDVVHTGGATPISASRRRQRDQVASALHCFGRPRLIWMLDDDVRLSHLAWSGTKLEVVQHYNHVEFLLRMADRYTDLDVLIGSYSGDPPIPAIATLATRLTDLAHNLRTMFASRPDESWGAPQATLDVIREHDAYYDFSVDRAPAWERVVCWLPRHGATTVVGAYGEMLAEIGGVPFGAAFTRPILADRDGLDVLGDSTRRGGNAVFFDPDACVEHDYPGLDVAGVATRRSDMIGTRLLTRSRPGRVRSSLFSVLHERPRAGAWPTKQDLERSLLADTFGAILSREVDARAAGQICDGFAKARLDRIRRATTQIALGMSEVAEVMEGAPSWACETAGASRIGDILGWVTECVPGARDGRLPEDLATTLASPESLQRLRDRAQALVKAGP